MLLWAGTQCPCNLGGAGAGAGREPPLRAGASLTSHHWDWKSPPPCLHGGTLQGPQAPPGREAGLLQCAQECKPLRPLAGSSKCLQRGQWLWTLPRPQPRTRKSQRPGPRPWPAPRSPGWNGADWPGWRPPGLPLQGDLFAKSCFGSTEEGVDRKFGQRPVQEQGLREEKPRQVRSQRVRTGPTGADISFLSSPLPNFIFPQIPPSHLHWWEREICMKLVRKGAGARRGRDTVSGSRERGPPFSPAPWGLHNGSAVGEAAPGSAPSGILSPGPGGGSKAWEDRRGSKMRQCLWEESPRAARDKARDAQHRPLGAEPVSREEKLSVKVVWRFGNPDRPGWEEL